MLRATALGDFVFALPALEALRAAYPGAEIVLVAREWHRRFLEGRPGPVDRVIPLPEGTIGDEGVPPVSPEVRSDLLGRLGSERFDLAIQLHGGGRNSNRIVGAIGAGTSAGASTPDAPPLDRSIPYVYWQSEILRCLEVVGLVGATPVALEPRLAVTERDRERSRDALPDDGRPMAALHPGASDPRRRWPPSAFAGVARDLARRGLRVVVTGTAAEAAIASAVVREAGAGVEDLSGRLDLSALVGTLERCAVVVSNDTGPLHVAAAVGTPTVGIFWCGNLVNGGHPFRARHRPAISWRTACPTCGRDCIREGCDHDASFVADVPVDEVLAAALELLPGYGVTDRAGGAPRPGDVRDRDGSEADGLSPRDPRGRSAARP